MPALPPPVLLLGSIASVQFGSAFAITLFPQAGPGGIVLLRLGLSAAVLTAISRPSLRGRSRADLLAVLAFGVILGSMNWSFYEGLNRVPIGVAVTIEFVGPLAVAVLGSRRRIDLAWALLAAVGILALTRGGTSHLSGVGIALALLAAAFWACYILLQARIGRAFQGGTGLALAMCVASVLVLPFGIAHAGAHLLAPGTLAVGCAVGMLSSAIPYSLELEALRRIAPPVFGVLMSIEPAMAALAGFVVLGQNLDARALAGIALVVVASVGASRSTRTAPLDV